MAKALAVLVNGEPLGLVEQAANGRLTFEYDGEWLRRIDVHPLSLSMPVTAKRHTHNAIASYLAGLLPDNERTLDAIAKKHGVSRHPFALIGAIGEDLAGAVQIVPPERLGKLRRREGARPISEARLAKFLDELVRDPASMQIDEDAGLFSLAGAQPKKAISWVNGKWYEPRGRTPSTHIIKPPIPHLEGQVENEHFCLRLAEACGLPTVRSQVVMIGGKPNIVTDRYDRRRSQGGRTLPLTRGGGMVVRLHQEDMCQALGVHPANKYQSDKGPNIRAIMDLLSGSGNPAADRARFIRACAFNFIILGTDAHAKNFSLLIEHANYRLAPLYDINSVLPYDRLDSRKLAMSIGAEYRWRHIGWRNWQKQAETCQFPVEALRSEFRTLLDRAPQAAADTLRQCQKDGLKTPILPQLAQRIDGRCTQLTKAFGI